MTPRPREIYIATGLALPLDIVTQTIGVLAKRRAGKSYFLRRLVEQLFRAGQQVVIADPKGDWWGIRSAADGRGEGLSIVILGGEHGDVPLEAGSGEVVAKMIVEEQLSVLLDLSLFRKHEVATFMTAFLENLYRLKAREQYRTPLMLVIDEADAIAPQQPMKGEERMLGAAEDIVRRGGQRGIGCTMATQRTAVLNKNVLTQIQVLVALRTIAPQDLKAMDAWVDVHGTKEERSTLMESLPALPIGDAWVWSPGWPTTDGIFQRIHTSPIETFDSGATPKPGQPRREPKRIAQVDLDALRRQMAETLERAKATDPKLLQKRIMDLEREVKAKPTAPPKIDQASIDRAVRAATQERDARIRQIEGRWKRLGQLFSRAFKLNEEIADELLRADATPIPPIAKVDHHSTPPVAHVRTAGATPRAAAEDGERPTGALRRIMVALAQHQEGLNYRRIGVFSGVSTRGGSFSTYLSRGRARQWISGDDKGGVFITDEGLTALGDYEPLPRGDALLEFWLNEFGRESAPGRILKVVADEYPNSVDAADVGRIANLSTKGGSWSTYLSRLRSRDLITGSSNGRLRADPSLFH